MNSINVYFLKPYLIGDLTFNPPHFDYLLNKTVFFSLPTTLTLTQSIFQKLEECLVKNTCSNFNTQFNTATAYD